MFQLLGHLQVVAVTWQMCRALQRQVLLVFPSAPRPVKHPPTHPQPPGRLMFPPSLFSHHSISKFHIPKPSARQPEDFPPPQASTTCTKWDADVNQQVGISLSKAGAGSWQPGECFSSEVQKNNGKRNIAAFLNYLKLVEEVLSYRKTMNIEVRKKNWKMTIGSMPKKCGKDKGLKDR